MRSVSVSASASAELGKHTHTHTQRKVSLFSQIHYLVAAALGSVASNYLTVAITGRQPDRSEQWQHSQPLAEAAANSLVAANKLVVGGGGECDD